MFYKINYTIVTPIQRTALSVITALIYDMFNKSVLREYKKKRFIASDNKAKLA